MIICGWCDNPTDPGLCSYCGRDPALPWTQRGTEPPDVSAPRAGRPTLDAGQIRQKLRIAIKELGDSPTKAALAEHLGIDTRTLGRWQKLAG